MAQITATDVVRNGDLIPSHKNCTYVCRARTSSRPMLANPPSRIGIAEYVQLLTCLPVFVPTIASINGHDNHDKSWQGNMIYQMLKSY